MIQVCKQCGAVNAEYAETCRFCDSRFETSDEAPALPPNGAEGAAGVSLPTEGNLAVEPDWRSEVAHRLAAFRARRRHLRPDDSQAPLPFSEEDGMPEAEPGPIDGAAGRDPAALLVPRAELEPAAYTPPKIERVEIEVTQRELNFADAEDAQVAPAGPLVAVASLAERRRAGLLDTTFLLLAYGGFLVLFELLGGRLTFGQFDAAVFAATLTLFYLQYFALFTVFGGSTPGMLLRGLRVVSFDGSAPGRRQLLWRSFGYLVSGGTAFLGFLWALWDEDHLTWHDRMSQTYLTQADAELPAEPEPSDMSRELEAFVKEHLPK